MKLRFLQNYSIYLVLPILAACGGGSGGSSDPASVAANAVDPATVVNVARHPASVSGTAIPPSTSINDASGAVWTVKSGVVYRAGKTAGFSMNVSLLLWYAGQIYQEKHRESMVGLAEQ